MKNLAGIDREIATKECAAELAAALIPAISMPQYTAKFSEVKSEFVGRLNGWFFVRTAVYWIARSRSNPFPADVANQIHFDCRVNGDCARRPADRDVEIFHVDKIDGLIALVTAIKKLPFVDPSHEDEIRFLLHTQDNRCTAEPFFVVQEKHRIYGIDADEHDASHEWMTEDCDGKADDDEAKELDEKYDNGEPTPGWVRVGYVDEWRDVTGCFTEQGAKQFIRINGHNLKEPRIYAKSLYRNAEMIAIRKRLMGADYQ
jgi:hypothetical protein